MLVMKIAITVTLLCAVVFAAGAVAVVVAVAAFVWGI